MRRKAFAFAAATTADWGKCEKDAWNQMHLGCGQIETGLPRQPTWGLVKVSQTNARDVNLVNIDRLYANT